MSTTISIANEPARARLLRSFGFDKTAPVVIAIATFSAMHCPQPLLPLLQQAFDVEKTTVSLVTTATLLPLGLAPLFYGLLLRAFPAHRLLVWGSGLLMAATLALSMAPDFPLLLGLRVVQGLLAPAVLTSLMTLAGATMRERQAAGMLSEHSIGRAMAVYVAATIFGGFFGRFLAGTVASVWGWRWGLGAVSLLTVAAWLMALGIPRSRGGSFARLELSALAEVLRKPGFLPFFCFIFVEFFIFTALLNLLPFRIAEIGAGSSPFRVAVLYVGYLIGILISLAAPWTVLRLGGEARTVRLGALVLLLCVPLFLATTYGLTFVAVLVLCIGMFQVHSVLPGWLNELGSQQRSVVNGLYLSFYYVGGAAGSALPAVLYRHSSWAWTMAALGAMQLVALALCLTGGRRTPP
ncbi:MFS transporter [Megalodesulfovibrio gigas]|uniref:Putative major facilitator superfamily protein n=1 Tax=Megalodesulfovibrio gigas (strain ATCC 19364 / DSM 1382 / NCIMB 9332 / VKM B-1759) TaxID=1121448 RepID=T2GAB7_MEGG1|nr:MFS transporter [Megalodesulfovibrio gigas]AGW12867.1 putative major facilitator superfamily protein [Megalodesulfovibrio gigas DSM 1382 = ATCC 19364]